jgi:hypothetical protein
MANKLINSRDPTRVIEHQLFLEMAVSLFLGASERWKVFAMSSTASTAYSGRPLLSLT